MDPYIKAWLVLAGLSVLSAVLVINWCIVTDKKYMEKWKDDDELL